MLYDSWRSIVHQFGSETALTDASDGRKWSFTELALEAEQDKPPGEIVFPKTNCPEFVIEVLSGWHHGRVVCPLEPGQEPPKVAAALPSNIAHLKTTSATGGDPRLVAFTGPQLAADAANLVSTMGMRPDWPNLGAISLAHSYGFSNLVLPLLLHGIPLILVRAALPEALKRAASRSKAVTVAGVPALWKTWSEGDAIPSNVKLAISAGAPLPLQLEREVFDRYGVKVHNFYGSSECGGIAYDALAVPRTDSSCVGSSVANVDVSLNEEGCVVVRSRAVGEGYWPHSDPRLGNGVFVTSDLGQFREGTLCLRGRVGDLINIAGRKVAPEVIEHVLAGHPGVCECLAFGVPLEDDHRGESIVGCVAARPGITGEDLRRFASGKLQAWQVPREWWFVDSLQADGRGKLSRAAWRARYLARARK